MIEDEMNYNRRLALLREKKIEHTQAKVRAAGFIDEDDYGTVPVPEDFHWQSIPNHPNGSFYGASGWAANFKSLMEIHPVYVDPLDALAGRWSIIMPKMRKQDWLPEHDTSFLREEQLKYDIDPGIGASSHFGPDYRIGLELGWDGLLAKVRHYRGLYGPEKSEFYQAEEDVILAVQTWIHRTIAHIHELEKTEPHPGLRANLEQMAAVNEWVIGKPPRTLREACQWIAWFNMVSRTYNRDGAGGQLDALLRPYYEKDIAAGLIEDEDAIFYIACLLLNDPHYYQLGGPGPDGQDVTSHISFLILEAAHRLDSSNNLTVRVHDGLNREFFLKSVQYLFEDRKGWPRFAGDKGLVEGFMRNGYPVELARERIAVGCNWMAIPGREYTMNDCVKLNAAKVFDVAFHEMMDDTGVEPSLDELWRCFESHFNRAILCTSKGIDLHLRHQKENAPELMMNLLCHGPVEKGLDVSDGGVEYYNMCIDAVGLATVSDSFAALEQRVAIEKALTWRAIHDYLEADYTGAEGERVRLMMKSSPKYGQGGSLGDRWAERVSELFTRLMKQSPTPDGHNRIPGWFSWSRTIKYGKPVGATPNGRHAGTPISFGANPDPGFRKDSAPTAMVKAVARVQSGYGNTVPIQLELDPGLSREEGGIEKVADLIETHFKLGGTLFNINVIDAEKIREAHRDPIKYPDLVVRVTGFTAYFAALSPEFRQLVVDRIIQE